MPYGDATDSETERIATIILDCAFRLHRKLGPGLLESIYLVCLEYELKKAGLKVLKQVVLPVVHDGVTLDAGLRLDLLVEDRVIVEVKPVERIIPVFEAQLLTYLKLTNLKLGLLINFNVELLKNGIKRIIH